MISITMLVVFAAGIAVGYRCLPPPPAKAKIDPYFVVAGTSFNSAQTQCIAHAGVKNMRVYANDGLHSVICGDTTVFNYHVEQ